MGDIGVILLIYTVRIPVVLALFLLFFEDFLDYRKKPWKSTNLIWVALYVLISYAYRIVICYDHSLSIPMAIIYLVRIIPFLCARYGIKPRMIFAVPFFEYFTDCVSQNVRYIFELNGKTIADGYYHMESDVFLAFTEILLLILFLILSLLKRKKNTRIRFIELTPAEYIVLFLAGMAFSLLEKGAYTRPDSTVAIKWMCVGCFAAILALVVHVITMRKQNYSMDALIGNLKEPMNQITESYIEMNEKNQELRKFRHDSKNLLLALGSLIKEGKIDQASEYIEKMQETIDLAQAKKFDTGNFIADVLLESKAKTAERLGINMSVEGTFPADKVDDVDLVILISNLLDNAIEAAEESAEKKIEIKSILTENIWALAVANSCDRKVVIRDNKIETTKEDRESHGFGLVNIERIACKYGGKLELSCENRIFSAKAILTFDK